MERIPTATRFGAAVTMTLALVVAQAATASAAEDRYTVVAGDTVWDLAKRYGTTVDVIAQANGLKNPSLIRIGQVLTIPGGTQPAAPSPAPDASYTVVAGDTLYAIARTYGTTVDAIVAANSIKNPSLIRIGQVLTIPGGAAKPLVGDTFAGRTYPADVVAAANANKAALNAMDVPSKKEMQRLVIQIAKDMGVDSALAQAVAYQESGFNQRAVSPANAIGTMQVIPASGEWASELVGRKLDLLDPVDNVTAGVAILKRLLRNGTPLETALAGYYQGETSVKKRGMNSDTKKYVANVIALMDRFD